MKKFFYTIIGIAILFACSSDDSSGGGQQMTDDTTDDGMPPVPVPRTAPCENGMAAIYPCNDYDLVYRFPLNELGAGAGNDSWGWTDASSGKEYAIMGVDNGTVFVDISADPPIYLGKMATSTFSSTWRDIKVYNDHAYVVSEANNHGMQIFDLTRLRNVTTPQSFDADVTFTEFGSAHNIVINEDTGYAYPVGANRNTFPFGGPIFLNIQNPTSPVNEGGYPVDAYSHDAQIVTYSGPDTEHVGKEILIGSNENEIIIADITDKANPVRLSTVSYSQVGYTHQGWFTEDQRYFIVGDETDELDFGFNTRTLVFNFEDLDSPFFSYTYTGSTAAIDHNGYVKDNTYYLSNYTAGLRTLSLDNVGTGLTEIGFFDTYPQGNNASFDGAWSVYPYFESGKIVISDINEGLFIVKKKN